MSKSHITLEEVKEDLRYLRLLAREFPTVSSVTTEIINLEAILHLPKPTEHFLADIHGEHEAFSHILNNASGVIREKIDVALAGSTTEDQRAIYASLIYYPKEKLAEIKQSERNMDGWYRVTLYRLIDICRHVASKNTRRSVRKAIPPGYEFIIRNYLSEIICLLQYNFDSGHYNVNQKSIRNSIRAKKMIQYIHDHFSEQLTISQIAKSASISNSECIRCFHHVIGMTPIQYLKEYRLHRACQMLSSTNELISDIALQCGFHDFSYFTKTFRETRGITPGEYRRTLIQ